MTKLMLSAAAIAAGALSLTACGTASSAAAPAAPAKTAPRTPPARTAGASPRPTAKSASDACYRRKPASGDIYVRMTVPGLAAQAQELGGEWTWNVTEHRCLTSVEMIIATAPTEAGNCTQVGYTADNPGYDPNATPARRLGNVAAQAGPAC
jgi:hypothetical protein